MILCVAGLLCAVPTRPATARERRAIAYWPSWKPVAGIPAGHLTHLVYAFATVTPQGTAALINPALDVGEGPAPVGGNFGALAQLKRRYPHLRVLVGVGGWNDSAHFSDAAATEAGRASFVQSCLGLFFENPRWPDLFDGIELDWEFPVAGGKAPDPRYPRGTGQLHRPDDTRNLSLLLAEFRRRLDALGATRRRPYLLTIDAPSGRQNQKHFAWDEVSRAVDWIDLMTYRFYGQSYRWTEHDAPLYSPADPRARPDYSVDSVVQDYLKAGVPADKLVVGFAADGPTFSDVPATNDGLYQPHGAPPPGRQFTAYKDLAPRNPQHLQGYTRHWDAVAKVPWFYNAASRVWISCDDPASVRAKAQYVTSHGLGGLMLWDLSADDGALAEAMGTSLGH